MQSYVYLYTTVLSVTSLIGGEQNTIFLQIFATSSLYFLFVIMYYSIKMYFLAGTAAYNCSKDILFQEGDKLIRTILNFVSLKIHVNVFALKY